MTDHHSPADNDNVYIADNALPTHENHEQQRTHSHIQSQHHDVDSVTPACGSDDDGYDEARASTTTTATTTSLRIPPAVANVAIVFAGHSCSGNGEASNSGVNTHHLGSAPGADHSLAKCGDVDETSGDNTMDPAAKRQRVDGDDTSIPAEMHGAFDSSLTEAAAQNKKVHSEQWNEMLERLKGYREKHGDTLVPKRFTQDPRLGTWVETQRVQYKRLSRVYDENLGKEVPQPNKRLTADRLQKLSDLGFCWSAKHMRKTGSSGSLSSTAAAAKRTSIPESSANANMSIAQELYASAPSPVPQTVTFTMQVPTPTPAPSPINPVVRAPVPSSAAPSAAPLAKASTTAANHDSQWDDFFQRLIRFKGLHGHTLVPRKYDADPKLGSWVETQRVLWNRDYNQNKDKDKSTWLAEPSTSAVAAANTMKRLSLERKEKLDSIGFVWSLRSKRIEDHWDEMFRQLVEYKDQHGDCLVPSRYEANLKLGKWVETQRYEYTKLQRVSTASDNDETVLPVAPTNNASFGSRPANPRLTPERLRRLESIGFEWKVKNKMKRYYDKQWDAMFQKLLEFKEKYGHVNVPKRYPENMKLGTWVHTQRIQYRKLTGENFKTSGKDGKLGAAGLKSDDSPTNYQDGSSSPPYAYPEENEDGSAAGVSSWTAEQAQSYRLTDARRKRLEEVGFCWSARDGNEKATLETGAGRITRNSYDDQWDAMFELLAKYKEEHGNTNVPKRYQSNSKLGTWVDTQRVQYKKLQKKIAQLQHQKSLEANGLSSNIMVDDNASVGSAGSSTGTPLVGRLTQDRINRLQGLGFVWSLRDDWAKHYEELKAYKAIHGHCNVPARYQENRRLGIWVSAQRQQYKILQQQKSSGSVQDQDILDAPSATDFGTGNGEQILDVAGTMTPASGSGAKARRLASLTQERIDLLNAIGFTWTIRTRDSLGESWNQRLHELRLFKQRYGHCLVPSRYEANPELGIWVGTQRTQYRLYMKSKETGVFVATSMNDDRIRELEEMGFVWALRGATPDEIAVAAAEAGLDIGDRMAGVTADSPIGHDPGGYHRQDQHDLHQHQQHFHHHNAYVLPHHQGPMLHIETHPMHQPQTTNMESASKHNSNSNSPEYIAAI